jgi:hypothetical protein
VTFLTPAELVELTGYKRPTAQRAWLDRNGISYIMALSGRPIVNTRQFSAQQLIETALDPDEHVTHPWRTERKPLDLWLLENTATWKRDLAGIRNKAVPYRRGVGPAASGIYFLLAGDGLLYVGKSVNIVWRLIDHRRAAKIPFVLVAWIELPSGALDEVERYYLKRMRPPCNIKGVH